jgi:hypothetical protein
MNTGAVKRSLGKLPGEFALGDIRSALKATGNLPPGTYFVAQTALSGPWALLALVVNLKNVIAKPIRTTGRTIVVPIPTPPPPLSIAWAVLFGMKQPLTICFVVENGTATKRLGFKRAAEAGAIWSPDPSSYP